MSTRPYSKLSLEERQLLKQKLSAHYKRALPHKPKFEDQRQKNPKKTKTRLKKLADEGFKEFSFGYIQCLTCKHISHTNTNRGYAHTRECPKHIYNMKEVT